MDLDEDQADMIRAAACLLAATAIKKSKARKRRMRRRKSVWTNEWLLKRHKYGMYEKLMKHLREGDSLRICGSS